jgi:hypothetical protein
MIPMHLTTSIVGLGGRLKGSTGERKGRIEEDVVMIMLEHSFCKSLNVNL